MSSHARTDDSPLHGGNNFWADQMVRMKQRELTLCAFLLERASSQLSTCAHASCLMTCPVRPFPSHSLHRFILCLLTLRLCEDRKQRTCMRVHARTQTRQHFQLSKLQSEMFKTEFNVGRIRKHTNHAENGCTPRRPRALGNSECPSGECRLLGPRAQGLGWDARHSPDQTLRKRN